MIFERRAGFRQAANNSFKPSPLRGLGAGSYDSAIAVAATLPGLTQALGRYDHNRYCLSSFIVFPDALRFFHNCWHQRNDPRSPHCLLCRGDRTCWNSCFLRCLFPRRFANSIYHLGRGVLHMCRHPVLCKLHVRLSVTNNSPRSPAGGVNSTTKCNTQLMSCSGLR